MKKLNVLVFPCGSENAGEIYQALRYSVHVNQLVGASGVSDHGEFRFENYRGDLPLIDDESFDDAFLALLEECQTDIVFATHDSVAVKLALLAQRQGFYLVNGNATTAQITRYKSETYALFQDCRWVPACYHPEYPVAEWPVLIKPDCGQGGKDVQRVDDAAQLLQAIKNVPQPLVVEFLPGEEITVDCFTDRKRQLIWAGPRSRERVRAGISMRSQKQNPDDEIMEIITTINSRLVFRGPWFVQLKKDKYGKWKLLEISCRIAGTMVFQRARGINLPLMTLHDFLEHSITPLASEHITLVDRSIKTVSRIDIPVEHVFIDLDDTLIINGHAVPAVMALLYQCKAQGKSLHLITRHISDPVDTLRQSAIAESLFDQVIHLTESTDKKSFYIPEKSLFIDNYFIERQDVAKLKNVAVMDVDAVEFLLR